MITKQMLIMATKKHQANTQSTQHQSLINSGETFHPQGCDLFAETKQEEHNFEILRTKLVQVHRHTLPWWWMDGYDRNHNN